MTYGQYFKDYIMTRLTDHELRERVRQACPDEPDIDGLVFGEVAVAKAAGYKNGRHFQERHLADITTCSPMGPHVLGQHTCFGHYYLVDGEVVTHVSSGAVLGDNIRTDMREQRRANVPGWHKQSPVGSPDHQTGMTIVGSPLGDPAEWPALTIHRSEDR